MQYIGIDVSKATFVVAYSPEKSRKTSTFANTAAGIKKFMKTIDPSKHHCVMEATGNYSLLLVYLLSKAGYTVSMENPLKVKNFARTMLTVIKTDEVDARLIALYGERMEPAPYKIKDDSLLKLKQKRTILRQLKKQLSANRNIQESFNALPVKDQSCEKALKKTIEFLEKQVKAMTAELETYSNEEFKKQLNLLTSVKGIGITVATALIVATGAFTYFSSAKQLTRYLGLSPTYQQSGTSVRYRGHINRNGDPYLRSNLYIAACSSLRCNKECKAFYERLRANGKPAKLAVVAVANKLVRQAFSVVMNNTPYEYGFVSNRPNGSCGGSAMRQGTAQSGPTSTVKQVS